MDIVERLRRDADRWMAGDMGRDNEEAGWLSDEAATEIETLRAALKAAEEKLAAIEAEDQRVTQSQMTDLKRHLKEQDEIREAARWSSQ